MQKTFYIKQQEYQSVVDLTIPPQKKAGNCFNCQLTKPIYLIAQKQGESYEKKYCWACTLSSFYELEQIDYQIANKKEVLQELRTALYQTELTNYERQH